MNDTFILEQQQSLWQLYRFTLYQAPRLKKIGWVFYLITGVFILSIAVSLLQPLKATHNLWITISSTVAPFILLCAFYFIGTFLICLLIKIFRPAIFNTVIYQFTHWGMFKKNAVIDYSCPWRNILKIKETKSWLLLYISEDEAHVIEKKQVADKLELEALKLFIKSNLKSK